MCRNFSRRSALQLSRRSEFSFREIRWYSAERALVNFFAWVLFFGKRLKKAKGGAFLRELRFKVYFAEKAIDSRLFLQKSNRSEIFRTFDNA